MRIQHTPIYTYDELSDEAKEKARDWFRQFVFTDSFDWEHVIEDACEIGDLMGLDLRQAKTRRQDGSFDWAPSIVFSGFWSQGDGAAFDATYRYKKGALAAVKKHAPKDEELHRIAKGLQEVQRPNFYRLEANTTTTRGNNMRVNVSDSEEPYRDVGEAEDTIRDLLNDYAHWIYKRLEAEYEYQSSDEVVEECIRANEYEFLESGDTP